MFNAIKSIFAAIGSAFVAVVKFFAAAFTEPDGNGGKASWARLAGTYVVWRIVEYELTGKTASSNLMTIFWVLVGFAMISKVLERMSPAVLDIAKSFLVKAGVQVKIPEITKTESPTAGAPS